jgi:predicted dehydrogenase
MNLSPEEKQVGKDNFNEATGTTRRDFLKGAVATAVAAGGVGALGGAYFKYTKIDNPLRVGIIGTGDEGNVLIGALNPDYIDVVAIADIRPYSRYRAYHGDWYAPGALAARPGLLKVYEKKYGWKNENEARNHITEYHDDYKALLDNDDVEAVIIALPLHLHHEAAVAALRKGKHVLTEKLMGQTVAQCKEMARVAAETGLVMAVGHQRHYSILYDNAVDQIRRGLIGDIHHIRAQWHRGNLPGKDSWQPPLPCAYMTPEEFKKARESAKNEGKEKQFLEEFGILPELHAWEAINAGKHRDVKPTKPEDIAMWRNRLNQKKAQLTDIAIADVVGPEYGYQSKTLEDGRVRTPLEELIRWRLWNRTGGGLMAELGSHQLDASSIFIAAQNDGHKVKPLSVTAVGGRHIFPADRDCDDHVYCTFEFPGKGYYKTPDSMEVGDPNKKIVVTYSSINGNGFGGYGEIVFGTNGTLILEQEQDAMLFKGSDTATRIGVKMSGEKAAMDTYETGGGAAAVAAAATPQNVSRGYREEIEHWAWCIRNPGNEPHCTPTIALGDAVIALTSNLAIAEQKRIEFDPKWFDPNDDATPEGEVPRKAADVT